MHLPYGSLHPESLASWSDARLGWGVAARMRHVFVSGPNIRLREAHPRGWPIVASRTNLCRRDVRHYSLFCHNKTTVALVLSPVVGKVISYTLHQSLLLQTESQSSPWSPGVLDEGLAARLCPGLMALLPGLGRAHHTG